MKKRLNVTFFGICFLASLIAEAYCLQVLNGDLLSSIGIGIVVLITGYLFLDSIGSSIKLKMENIKFYTDTIMKEETERWDERYTELVNLQKATYTATKKNTVIISEQMKEILTALESMKNDYFKEQQRIIELQKKSMEGQKNALNMELHHNKENTNKLIEVLREEGNKPEIGEQLSSILNLLDVNNELLKNDMIRLESIKFGQNFIQENVMQNFTEKDFNLSGDNIQDNKLQDYKVQGDYAQDDEVLDYKVQDDYAQDDEVLDYKVQDDYVPEELIQQKKLKQEIKQSDEFDSFENMSEFDNKEYREEDYGTEDNPGQYIPELQDKDEEPEFNELNEDESKNTVNITPLYDDPNKALTADEIAKLFASFGQ